MAELEQGNDVMRARTLDDLPEHLILYIFTFLPTLDAVRLSLLRRQWRNLLSSVPSLNFDYHLFPPTPDSPCCTRRRFASFLDLTLIRRSRSPILKFRFQFDFADTYWSHVDSWIQYAISNNAIDLDIDFCTSCVYDFTFGWLKSSCVRNLKLCRCDLILPYNMPSLTFKSIRSVHLDEIYLEDQMVVDFISGCVNLESLVLANCYGMRSLRICSSTLKKLSLWFFHTENEDEESLEISCPNLRSVSIFCFQMGKYCINNSTSLVEAEVEFVHELRNYCYWSKLVRLFSGVKRLKVQNWWFKLLCQNDASSESFAFKNLNHLELKTKFKKHDLLGIAALFKISPNITTLTLDYLYKVDKDENLSEELLNKPVDFTIPNLKILKLKHFRVTEKEMDFLALLKNRGTAMERVVICQPNGDISFPLRGSS